MQHDYIVLEEYHTKAYLYSGHLHKGYHTMVEIVVSISVLLVIGLIVNEEFMLSNRD